MSFLLNNIPVDPIIERFIELSYGVSERIIRLLDEKGLLQRDLALKLGKKDSEVSKWLQGNHNLTLKTIATIEIALNEKLIKVQGLDSTNIFTDRMSKPANLLVSKSSGEESLPQSLKSNSAEDFRGEKVYSIHFTQS
ncbi:helix-turn-helix domain-containing protein [Spirosoma luteum]|uniref:helix-turn-helix domain-containing protein n=1 Tax=Spirosoma luteum TaxID=431553 RepID=UPI0003759E1D|nr:helix-turn-helix transcriptional regulator [Spirosoma luteum]